MITKKALYGVICDLSVELDVLNARLNSLDRKVKALESKPGAKTEVKRGRGRPRKNA